MILKSNRKLIALVTAFMFVMTLFAPFAMQEASADSKNVVASTPRVADDYKSEAKALTSLFIFEDRVPFSGSNVGEFRLILPSGMKWVKDAYKTDGDYAVGEKFNATTDAAVYEVNKLYTDGYSLVNVSDRILHLKEEAGFAGVGAGAGVEIPLFVEVDGATGALEVELDALDGTLTSGKYTIGYASTGATVTVVEDVKTVSEKGAVGTIRIDETAIGAMSKTGEQKITLRLPVGFKWYNENAANVKFTGGFDNSFDRTIAGSEFDGRYLRLSFTDLKSQSTRGTIYIEGLGIQEDGNPRFGDVEVRISGDKVTTETLQLAKYADFDATVKADGKPRELVSGRLYESGADGYGDKDDLKLQTLIIKEDIAGSLLPRKTVVEFPSWVKIVDVKVESAKVVNKDTLEAKIKDDIKGDSNKVEFIINDAISTSSKIEAEITFFVSVKANEGGDIVAKVSGRSGAEGEAVLGVATVPVKGEADKVSEVRIGVRDQQVDDVLIIENVEESMVKDGTLTFKLDNDVTWSRNPKIEVIDGDLELDLDSLSRSNEYVHVNVKNVSSEPSTIKISNIVIDVNRSVAEGNIYMFVAGDAVVQNHKTADGFDGKRDLIKDTDGSNTTLDAGEFDQSWAARFAVAKVVTPAPGETRTNAVFAIDSTTYTVDGKEMTMDVAPYIKDSRTFMPVFFVAQALGVNENNIMWEPHTKTVTILKGDRIAQMTIGSNILTVNGAQIVMDTAPEINNGRTMLPVFFVGQALGAEVIWDGDARTVEVRQ